ncbi:MAG: cytochrome b/b6 domain-containing protein [Phenylobacterium sp.]|nr:cytochrome b/b6 domain-containing protein [Phenylobacterium sp.]
MSVKALKAWARGHARQRRYSPVGITFHWTAAALVLFQLGWGLHTSRLPVGPDKLAAYDIHIQVGLAILLLTLLRMTWRLMVPGPVNDADKPGWRSTAAHLTHYAFYACLVGLPLSGWAMLSATATAQPLTFLGAPWPFLPFHDLDLATRWAVEAWAGWIHAAFILALCALIPVHAGAALHHHFVHHHDVLEGMVPGITALEETMRQDPPRRPKPRRSRKASAAG